MPTSDLFLENLRRLHRDERSFLATLVSDVPLTLGASFHAALQSRLGIEVPEDAFVAFDFQIASVYAAAVMAEQRPGPHPSGGGIERGNQETIDLLVAWPSGEGVELLVIEAEGVSGWSGKRLLSRALWLGDVFGYDSGSEQFAFLKPHFAIASPVAPPADLLTLEWPVWMVDDEGRPAWLEMAVPSGLLRVTKTDRGGSSRATGGFWLVEDATPS